MYWQKKIYFSYSDPGGTLENKLNDLKPLFSRKKSFAFQNTEGQILPTRINNNHRKLICMSRTIHDFSVWDIASPVGVFRGDRISSLPTKGGEEIRSPLKTPAREAIWNKPWLSFHFSLGQNRCFFAPRTNNNNNKFIQYYHFVQVLPIKITIINS